MGGIQGTQVVFVDDEPGVCDAVRKTLERVGIRVQCFPSAQDCLAHLAENRCDLLVTDVRMPGKDGLELLREVRRQLPWLPVVVVTGYGDVPMAVRAMRSGAVDFLEKPLDRQTLLDTVRTLLERDAAQSRLFDLALTETEMRVLRFILDGRNNRDIAVAMHRSPRTVEAHRSNLMRKLGASNVVELLRRAADAGLLDDGLSGAGEASAC
jgi:two-component system response regulator FixJ